ncbi:MAG: SMI1/KNR4 family protein [Ruminococcus sp.]|nr:SMI1/KNR4 family protein [Ruminococcus sp.]
MTRSNVENILKKCLKVEYDKPVYPTKEEWERFEEYFECEFGSEFKWFIDFMSKYSFPGDIYNVQDKSANGNDTIIVVYEHESKYDDWDKDMIPFLGIGNGDYFCINKKTKEIFYYYAEVPEYEKTNSSFSEWIEGLPAFLEG